MATKPPKPFESRLIPAFQVGSQEALATLRARATERYTIQAQAEVMSEGDLARLQEWMKYAPTTDPMVVLPLMLAQVAPGSEFGQSAQQGDIAARIADGTYANNLNIKGDGLGNSTYQGNAPVPKPDDHQTEPEQSWWQTALDNVVPDPNNEFWDNLMPDANTGVGEAVGHLLEFPQAMSRASLATFTTPFEFVVGGFRSAAGDASKISTLTDRWGLSEEEKNVALNLDAYWSDDPIENAANKQRDFTGVTSYKDLSKDAQARVDGFLKQYHEVGSVTAGDTPGTEATGDLRARMLQGESVGMQAGKQTTGGQAIANPDLITKDRGSWLPSPEITAKVEAESVKAFDIRTADEVARGVEPMGWTPGRGIAHVWWDADTTAFNTMSGAVDMADSLLLDPVNYIPVGAAGKIAKLPMLLSKGSKASLERALVDSAKVAVRTDTKAAKAVAAGRKGSGNIAASLGQDATYKVDDVFVGRNVVITDDGRVLTSTGKAAPHSQFISGERAWAWLNSGKGQRVVDDLVGRTSAYDIWKRSGGERGGMNWTTAQALSDAKDAASVRAILGSQIGAEIDSAGMLTGFGQSPMILKFTNSALMDNKIVGSMAATARRQLAAGARGKVISAYDQDTLVREMDAFGAAAKVEHDVMAQHVDAVLRSAPNKRYEAMYGPNGFFQKAIVPRLVANGLEADDASLLMKAYEGGLDASQRDLWNQGIAFGGGEATGFPTIMGEGLGDAFAMPSYREILRAGSSVAKIRKAFGADAADKIGDALTQATSAWRNLVLLRPAYTLREVGEMGFSMALSGYDSFFTHPVQMIALATHIAQTYAAKTAAGHLLKAMATGEGDEMVRRELRSASARARVKWAEGNLGGAIATGAWAGTKRGVYEGSQIPMKVLSAPSKMAEHVMDYLGYSRGYGALAPFMDINAARVNGDAMFAEFERYMETGDPTHLSRIADAMALTHGNFVQDEVMRQYGTTLKQIRRPVTGEEDDARLYARALADRLRRGHEDPDVRNIASGMDVNDILADYQQYRKAQRHIEWANSRSGQEWANPLVKSDLDFIKAQEDTLHSLTGSDTDLLEAVATGKFNGKALGADNKDLVNAILDRIKQDNSGFPDYLGYADPKAWQAASDKFSQVSNDFFQNTAAFSDVFARGPLVREAYVRRVVEIAHAMSPAAKAEIVKNLRDAGDIYLARKVQGIKATGGLGVDEVDAIAAGFALKETQRVFYDAGRRQNWALAARVVMPFAQATANTFKRWGLMSLQNPQSYYRAMKPLVALQQPGSAVLYDVLAGMTGDPTLEKFYEPGKPSLSANGFFYTDRYGDRKFAYPLVGPIARMFDLPSGMVMESSLENLNVAGTTLNPGLGPLITLPAAFALNDTISEDSFKGDVIRAMFPYGLPGGNDSALSKIVFSALPTAYRKAYESSFDSNARMNTSIAVMSALVASGNYDLSSNAERTRLQNDAEQLAQRIMLYSAIGGTFTPSTFSPDVLVKVTKPEDKAGVTQWMMADRVMEEFQKYTKDDYKTGALNFVQDFGTTALFSALPRTKTTAIAQATNDMWKFRTDHEAAYQQNLEVIGLFMSNDDLNSNFARELFMEQRGQGVRQYLTPAEYTEKVNDQLGWILWNATTAEIDKQYGDNPDKVASLRALARKDLIARFPGFSPSAKDTGKNMELIEKVKDALKDPAVQSLPSAYYIDRYLRQRDAAMDALIKAGGTGNLDAKGNNKVAAALRAIGTQYANEDTSGGFRHIWNRLLSQELYEEVTK